MGTWVESPSARMMHILVTHHTQGGLAGGEGHGISSVLFQIQDLSYKWDVRLSNCQLELLVTQEHVNHFRRAHPYMGTSVAAELIGKNAIHHPTPLYHYISCVFHPMCSFSQRCSDLLILFLSLLESQLPCPEVLLHAGPWGPALPNTNHTTVYTFLHFFCVAGEHRTSTTSSADCNSDNWIELMRHT